MAPNIIITIYDANYPPTIYASIIKHNMTNL